MSELNATWNWTVKSAPEDRPEMEIPRGSIDKFVGNGTAVGEANPNAEDETAAKEMQARTGAMFTTRHLAEVPENPGRGIEGAQASTEQQPIVRLSSILGAV